MSADLFRYDASIGERFPQARAEVLLVAGVGGVSAAGLAADYEAAQAEVVESLVAVPPADRSSISAWRSVFTAFGVKPTRHRNAAEALLRRLQRHGDIPSIGPTVDLGNLVSIRHSLPVAAFDLDGVTAPLTVRIASGAETFTGIGADEPDDPVEGEVVFVDSVGAVAARRWCWKQSGASATGPTTDRVLYVIEGVHDGAAEAVHAAGDELADLVARHLPAAALDRWSVEPGVS